MPYRAVRRGHALRAGFGYRRRSRRGYVWRCYLGSPQTSMFSELGLVVREAFQQCGVFWIERQCLTFDQSRFGVSAIDFEGSRVCINVGGHAPAGEVICLLCQAQGLPGIAEARVVGCGVEPCEIIDNEGILRKARESPFKNQESGWVVVPRCERVAPVHPGH